MICIKENPFSAITVSTLVTQRTHVDQKVNVFIVVLLNMCWPFVQISFTEARQLYYDNVKCPMNANFPFLKSPNNHVSFRDALVNSLRVNSPVKKMTLLNSVF